MIIDRMLSFFPTLLFLYMSIIIIAIAALCFSFTHLSCLVLRVLLFLLAHALHSVLDLIDFEHGFSFAFNLFNFIIFFLVQETNQKYQTK